MKHLEELEKLRLKIENVDKVIIEQLMHRLSVIKEIGELKAKYNLDYIDINREEKLIKVYTQICSKYRISEEFIKEIFIVIFRYCRKFQQPKF